jgi:hypothetical protein
VRDVEMLCYLGVLVDTRVMRVTARRPVAAAQGLSCCVAAFSSCFVHHMDARKLPIHRMGLRCGTRAPH